jgi:hypothetical protein
MVNCEVFVGSAINAPPAGPVRLFHLRDAALRIAPRGYPLSQLIVFPICCGNSRQSLLSPSLFRIDCLLVDGGNHVKVIQDIPDQRLKVRNIFQKKASKVGMCCDVP